MNVLEGYIVKPLPNDVWLKDRERAWHVVLPQSYKDFLKKYNGLFPNRYLSFCEEFFALDRFLALIDPFDLDDYGGINCCDIDVTLSQIGTRLIENPNARGWELLPIAVAFAGNFVCLDYRVDKENPSVCLWLHEESGDFEPTTTYVADSFEEFLDMLNRENQGESEYGERKLVQF